MKIERYLQCLQDYLLSIIDAKSMLSTYFYSKLEILLASLFTVIIVKIALHI
jgi:hypothetical protein